MFTQFKNIDTAFKHIKRFSIVFLVCCLLLTGAVIYFCFKEIGRANDKVMILYNGKVLSAFAAERRQNLAVELRDHIKTFHTYFFTLDPDEKAINANVAKAMYLADNSAKRAYDNLKEAGYYNNLISANISQTIEVDSIRLSAEAPYAFTCYATQTLIRSSSTVLRRLVTRGRVRLLNSQTDNNPHGFLIEGWETLENSDKPLNP